MPKQSTQIANQPETKKGRKPEPVIQPEQEKEYANIAFLSDTLQGAGGDGKLEGQAARLADGRLQSAQRWAIASQIGRMHGNLHLQRVVQVVKGNGFRHNGHKAEENRHTEEPDTGREGLEDLEGLGSSDIPALVSAGLPPNGNGKNGNGSHSYIQLKETTEKEDEAPAEIGISKPVDSSTTETMIGAEPGSEAASASGGNVDAALANNIQVVVGTGIGEEAGGEVATGAETEAEPEPATQLRTAAEIGAGEEQPAGQPGAEAGTAQTAGQAEQAEEPTAGEITSASPATEAQPTNEITQGGNGRAPADETESIAGSTATGGQASAAVNTPGGNGRGGQAATVAPTSRTGSQAGSVTAGPQGPVTEASPAGTSPGTGVAAAGVAAGGGITATHPTRPEDDPRFQGVQHQVGSVAARERGHQATGGAVSAAHAAAQSPTNETTSRAEAGQVDAMNQTPAGQFNREQFKQRLRQKIEELSPRNPEQARALNGDQLNQARGDLSSTVHQSQEQAQGNIEQRTQETPNAGAIPARQATPLEPAQPGPNPPTINGEQAVPASRPQAEVQAPFQANSQSLDQQMASANITDEQLANSNEPSFQGALQSKQQAQADAAQAPQEFRQQENAQINQAQSQANTAIESQTGAMHSSRTQLLSQVTGQQSNARGRDEQKRAEVASHIEGLYNETKTNVEARLNRLDQEVNQAFDQGIEQGKQIFDDHFTRRKDDLYSGPAGWALWLEHKILPGVPPEIEQFLREARQAYLNHMDLVIDRVAGLVETGLLEAKQQIADGKRQIQEYVAGLEPALRQVGQEAAQNIQGRFDELEQSVAERQDSLINSLAQRYVESVQAIDERMEQLRAENTGLISAAIDAIRGVIDTIVNLKNMLLQTLARAAAAVDMIIQDPIGFLGNMVNAVKMGLQNFVSNIASHLMQGLMSWLFGALADAGIQIPDSFDLKGILSIVLQVLGLTYANIRARAVAILGPQIVERLEQAAEIFKILVTEGPAGIWRWIQEKIETFKTMIIDQIKEFVMERIIMAGITWLIGLLNPASAFVKACKAIYDIVMFFVERGSQIMALVNAIIDSMTSIAQGSLSAAARFVENALARSIPVLIGFLASLLGLGGISEKIKEVIERIRAPINRVIDWVINKAVSMVRAVGGLFGGGRGQEENEQQGPDNRTVDQKQADLDGAVAEAENLEDSEDATPDDIKNRLPAIKTKYRLVTLNLVQDDSETYHIVGTVNPTKEGKSWRRPRDLPAWNKLTVNWQHIFDGHWEGTNQPVGNNDIFTGLNQAQIRRVVQGAYNNVYEKNKTQRTPEGDRIRVRGEFDGWTVEMWINKATKTLETAYPVF